MKKLLAILLALSLVLALAVPTVAAAEEIVVFENEAGDTMSGSDAYLNPWDSFAEGPFWGADHDAFPGVSIDQIKEYVKQGEIKFVIDFTANAYYGGPAAPIARFNAWDGPDGAYDVKFELENVGSNRYIGTVALDDLAAKYVSATGDETLDGITNFTVQLWSDQFKLYKAWFELPEPAPEIEIPDEQVYKVIEEQIGTLSGVSSELELLSLGTTLNTGDVVVLRLQGTTTGGFRYWLSAGAWTACSVQTTVSDTEFDILVEVEVTGNGADSLQFKGPSYGVNLDNLTVSYAGIFEGTMAEYEEAFAAKKAELIEAALKAKNVGKYTGYLSTGDDYHMVMINSAVITTPHEYDDANICVYCGHVGTADDEIIIEVTDPVESTTDEEEDVTVDVEEPVEDEEPVVEENPKTGLALAIVPMIVAAAAVVISKR